MVVKGSVHSCGVGSLPIPCQIIVPTHLQQSHPTPSKKSCQDIIPTWNPWGRGPQQGLLPFYTSSWHLHHSPPPQTPGLVAYMSYEDFELLLNTLQPPLRSWFLHAKISQVQSVTELCYIDYCFHIDNSTRRLRMPSREVLGDEDVHWWYGCALFHCRTLFPCSNLHHTNLCENFHYHDSHCRAPHCSWWCSDHTQQNPLNLIITNNELKHLTTLINEVKKDTLGVVHAG